MLVKSYIDNALPDFIFDGFYGGGSWMRYLSVTEIAKKWDVSERSVRNYCAQGRVNGAFLTGKTWNIPENAD